MPKERIFVTESVLKSAVALMVDSLKRRLAKHGVFSAIGPHEVLGVITEEYQELIGAIHQNNRAETKQELIDIAVSCIFGLASLNQQDIDGENAPKDGMPHTPDQSLKIVMEEIEKDYARFFDKTPSL